MKGIKNMKYVYKVIRRSGEILYTSNYLEECQKYVSDNCLTFSCLIRKSI